MRQRSMIGIWLVLVIVLILTGCGGPAEEGDEVVFTMDEIAEYDGQDGRPAYIVVDGTVYDVSAVPQWSGGAHQGVAAGQDVTEALRTMSPHDDSILSRAREVGTVSE